MGLREQLLDGVELLLLYGLLSMLFHCLKLLLDALWADFFFILLQVLDCILFLLIKSVRLDDFPLFVF